MTSSLQSKLYKARKAKGKANFKLLVHKRDAKYTQVITKATYSACVIKEK